MKEEIEIKLEKQDGITVFHMQGDLTSLAEPFLKEAYGKANDLGASAIVLQFDHGAYINSAGIAILIQLLAEAKKNNQRIGITGLSDHFRKIFGMVGITKFARIYDGLEDATQELS